MNFFDIDDAAGAISKRSQKMLRLLIVGALIIAPTATLGWLLHQAVQRNMEVAAPILKSYNAATAQFIVQTSRNAARQAAENPKLR